MKTLRLLMSLCALSAATAANTIHFMVISNWADSF